MTSEPPSLFPQTPSDIIDISLWSPEEFEAHGEGSRAKVRMYSPANVNDTLPFLIPSHLHMFKESNPRYPEQFWIEIIAYILGLFTNVPVPPAYVSINSKEGTNGALSEWFYGSGEAYTSGLIFMKALIKDYDTKTGAQHRLKHILLWANLLSGSNDFDKNWEANLTKILIFDTIIGNTDRHQDNWGIIWKEEKGRFSPAFDNGTSLGYNILETKIDNFNYEAYIKKGYHHVKNEEGNHFQSFELIEFLIEKYTFTKDLIREIINFDIQAFKQEIYNLCKFDIRYPLTIKRAEFVIFLIELRLSKLKKYL